MQQYLKENYRTATLEEAAAKVSLSPAYLSRVFKDKSGEGFSELLLRTRMEKACELLADIQYKSYDIAYYVGYDNPKNFSRAFKSYYGVTPVGVPQIQHGRCSAMKGMKRKLLFKRMWSFVMVMLIPALLLVAVTTYMTLTTQMRRMSESNARDIDAVQTNISLVLNSVVTQNAYLTGMTRTNMVMQKALRREALSYTDAIYLRNVVASLNSMTSAYDYVDWC